MHDPTSSENRPDRHRPPFSIEEDAGEVTVLRIRGELDHLTSPRLLGEAERVLLAGHDLEVDLSGVSFLDSSALGVLLQLAPFAERHDRQARISAASRAVDRVVAVTGVGPLLGLGAAEPTVD